MALFKRTTTQAAMIAAGPDEAATSTIVTSRDGHDFRISGGIPLWKAKKLADDLAAADATISSFRVLDAAGRTVYTAGGAE